MSNAKNRPHQIFGLERWGKGLVSVLPNGDVGLSNPLHPEAPAVSLPEILEDLKQRGIESPLLLRVGSYLKHEILRINESFRKAMCNCNYQGGYRGVFPIKVNQQAQVVDRIVEYGRAYAFGLEAGSKPELVIALSHRLEKEALIVCNGVKDQEFIRLAILSRKLDFNTIIVLESPRELDNVIEVVQELDQEPLLGVRVKLTNEVGGNWAKSSGERSTFGMNSAQLVDVIDRLREANLLHCLKLQHSHLGSQVPDIKDVRHSVNEACRYFAELCREGAELTHLDLGGGLGVDYTGEKRASKNSINYSVEEYCTNVVETVAYAVDAAGLKQPTLVTESGRAVAATSSMLIFDVLETTSFDRPTAPAVGEDDHHLVSDLAAVGDYMTHRRLQECINDATYYRNELRALFKRGAIGLRQMARAEHIYMNLAAGFKEVAQEGHNPDEVDAHLERLADIYHCNFSLFQSLPDIWAIDQLHPVTPLQKLNIPTDRRAVLSDITCDSDGKIDHFILDDGIHPSLPVHSIREGETYYMGVFFVGAYQETLGDLHNLFGDTNVATIDLPPNGGFELLQEVEGDTISEVLDYVEYDPKDCIDAFRTMVDRAISEGKIKASERRELMSAYRDSINGYTYYE